MSTTKKIVSSEDLLGVKWDACIANAANKTMAGLVMGSVFSLFLFRKRMWPVVFGTGAGFGIGYNNCQHEIRNAFKPQMKAGQCKMEVKKACSKEEKKAE